MHLLSGTISPRALAPTCEQLESRFLLSAIVRKGVLKITGTLGDDDINIYATKGQINVSLNNVIQSFDSLSVKSIRVDGGEGDDWIIDSTKLPSTLLGGLGDDTLSGGSANDLLIGGDGADHLFGNAGNDNLQGGLHDDVLFGGLPQRLQRR